MERVSLVLKRGFKSCALYNLFMQLKKNQKKETKQWQYKKKYLIQILQ